VSLCSQCHSHVLFLEKRKETEKKEEKKEQEKERCKNFVNKMVGIES